MFINMINSQKPSFRHPHIHCSQHYSYVSGIWNRTKTCPSQSKGDFEFQLNYHERSQSLINSDRFSVHKFRAQSRPSGRTILIVLSSRKSD